MHKLGSGRMTVDVIALLIAFNFRNKIIKYGFYGRKCPLILRIQGTAGAAASAHEVPDVIIPAPGIRFTRILGSDEDPMVLASQIYPIVAIGTGIPVYTVHDKYDLRVHGVIKRAEIPDLDRSIPQGLINVGVNTSPGIVWIVRSDDAQIGQYRTIFLTGKQASS